MVEETNASLLWMKACLAKLQEGKLGDHQPRPKPFSNQPPPKCPECGNEERICKDGFRHLPNGVERQRWLCSNCGLRFSERSPKPIQKVKVIRQSGDLESGSDLTQPSVRKEDLSVKKLLNDRFLSLSEDVVSHAVTAVGKDLNNLRSLGCERQVCESLTRGSKNLNTATEFKTVSGEGKSQERATIKGKILELCIHLKRQGYSDETIRLNRIALKVLTERGADLYNEGSVKDVIARQEWSDNRRRNVINAYDIFLKFNKLSWEKPKCTVNARIPFIPTEQEIDCLISDAGKKLSTFLQLLKETAMRRGEAKRLQWTDIDVERNIITLNAPEKNSNPRMWKVSPRLIAMLNALPKDSQKIFGNGSMDSLKSMFLTVRKRLAFKLQNPRLLEVNFHSFRHWKATTLMHQTHNDLYYVKQFLGHKSVKNTEIYLHIERTIFGESSNDEFAVKVAERPEEVKALLEVGFEYVCQKDNLIFLRKRR